MKSLQLLMSVVLLFNATNQVGADDPAQSLTAQPKLKAVLDSDLFDRSLDTYAQAENDCSATEAMMTKLNAAIATRSNQKEFQWLGYWMTARLAPICPLYRREALLKVAQQRAKELRANVAPVNSAAVPAPATIDFWPSASDALVAVAYSDYDRAMQLSAEAMRLGRDQALVVVTRAEVLFQKAKYDFESGRFKAGQKNEEVSQAISLLTEALRSSLPKSLNQLANLTLARLEELNGDPKLAIQYYRTYTMIDAKNHQAFARMGDLLLKTGDCVGAEAATNKAMVIKRTDAIERQHGQIAACIESNAARTLATAPASETAAENPAPATQ